MLRSRRGRRWTGHPSRAVTSSWSRSLAAWASRRPSCSRRRGGCVERGADGSGGGISAPAAAAACVGRWRRGRPGERLGLEERIVGRRTDEREDRSLGLEEPAVSRRDFLGGSLLGTGAILLGMAAPGLARAQGAE